MKRVTLSILFFTLHTLWTSAQTIKPELLKSLESQTPTSAEQAIGNALQQEGGIAKMAKVAGNPAALDTYFSNETKNEGITNQEGSGRCWLFTGLNMLRHHAAKKMQQPGLMFSQCYVFFYDQLEKSNLFLQAIIDTRKQNIDSQKVQWLLKNPLSDGGTYTGVADLVSKYGLVPAEVQPETYISNNTSEFDHHISRKLREIAINIREKSKNGASEKQLIDYKDKQLKTIYYMLTLAYGQPVKTFTWAPRDKDGKCKSEPKQYTPLEFYHEWCSGAGNLLEDYVMLMNDPSRPYNRVYEIDMDRHLYDGHNWLYLNLDIKDLSQCAINSIKDSTQLYFSCDVGKFLNKDNGLLDENNYNYQNLLGTTFGMDKRQRIQTFDSGSSHAMTLMGVDLDKQGNPTKWKVENSWGPSYGHKGYLIMTDKWFQNYMFRVVVNKKYIPENILLLMKQKPIILPAWDPMFSPEE